MIIHGAAAPLFAALAKAQAEMGPAVSGCSDNHHSPPIVGGANHKGVNMPTVTIQTINGPTQVKAYSVAPGLAAHRTLGNVKTWTLSHIPSGYRVVGGFARLRDIKEGVERASTQYPAFDWNVESDALNMETARDFRTVVQGGTPWTSETLANPWNSEPTFTWGEATFNTPSVGEVRGWLFDSVSEALDGCTVEPDGTCSHGYPSWLVALGVC